MQARTAHILLHGNPLFLWVSFLLELLYLVGSVPSTASNTQMMITERISAVNRIGTYGYKHEILTFIDLAFGHLLSCIFQPFARMTDVKYTHLMKTPPRRVVS